MLFSMDGNVVCVLQPWRWGWVEGAGAFTAGRGEGVGSVGQWLEDLWWPRKTRVAAGTSPLPHDLDAQPRLPPSSTVTCLQLSSLWSLRPPC